MPITRTKPVLRFSPAGPALAAVGRALGTFTQRVEALGRTVTNTGDVEAVHAFRVALRTLRSLLRVTRIINERRARRRFNSEFAWLMQRSNAVRDLDVLLAAWPSYVAQTGDAVPPAAQRALFDAIKAARQYAFADLRAALQSLRYRLLLKDWKQHLTAQHEEAPPVLVGRALGDYVISLTEDLVKTLQRYRSRELRGPTRLHEFRKDGKRLRYFLEAFASVYDADELAATLAILKRMQSELGARWDLEVHGQLLVELARRAHWSKEQRSILGKALHAAATRNESELYALIDKTQRTLRAPAIRHIGRGRRA